MKPLFPLYAASTALAFQYSSQHPKPTHSSHHTAPINALSLTSSFPSAKLPTQTKSTLFLTPHTSYLAASNADFSHRSSPLKMAQNSEEGSNEPDITPTTPSDLKFPRTLVGDTVTAALQALNRADTILSVELLNALESHNSDHRDLYYKANEQRVVKLTPSDRASLLDVANASKNSPTTITPTTPIPISTPTTPSELMLLPSDSRLSDVRNSLQTHYNTRISETAWSWLLSALPHQQDRITTDVAIDLNSVAEKLIELHCEAILSKPDMQQYLSFYQWALESQSRHLITNPDFKAIRQAFSQFVQKHSSLQANLNKTHLSQPAQLLDSETAQTRLKQKSLAFLDQQHFTKPLPEQLFKTDKQDPIKLWRNEHLSQLIQIHNPENPLHLINSLGTDHINIGVTENDQPLLVIQQGATRNEIRQFLQSLTGKLFSIMSENRVHHLLRMKFSDKTASHGGLLPFTEAKQNSGIAFFKRVLMQPELIDMHRVRKTLEKTNHRYEPPKASTPPIHENDPDDTPPPNPPSSNIAPNVDFLMQFYSANAFIHACKESYEQLGNPLIILDNDTLETDAKQVFQNLEQLLESPDAEKTQLLNNLLYGVLPNP